MKLLTVGLFTVGFLSYAASQNVNCPTTQQLVIKWQRLMSENEQTCERCDKTQEEVAKAYQRLKDMLASLGIEVILEDQVLDEEAFAKDPQASNRIWINGKTLEEWLGAETRESACVTCCEILGKEIKCRTIEFAGKIFESIPANLIIKAGLIAASHLINLEPAKSCCGNESTTRESCGVCPNKN